MSQQLKVGSRLSTCYPPPILGGETKESACCTNQPNHLGITLGSSPTLLSPPLATGWSRPSPTSPSDAGAGSRLGPVPMPRAMCWWLSSVVSPPEKLSKPRWCCCPCWESPTCCSSSTRGRMRSPGLSSSTSTPSWSPSR